MKLLLLACTCHALVPPPRRLAVGRPLAPRFAPPNKVAIPLEGTYAVSSEQKEVPLPHTKLGIGLIVTALVLQSAGASLLARRPEVNLVMQPPSSRLPAPDAACTGN